MRLRRSWKKFERKKQVYKEKQKKALDAMYNGERYVDPDDVEKEKNSTTQGSSKKHEENGKMEDVEDKEEAEDEDEVTHIQNESADDEVVKTYINEAYEDENTNNGNSNQVVSSKDKAEEVAENDEDTVEVETDDKSDE
eukprot:TRINITY_DN1073_c0_g1_i2.p3 TRINITY_DN1073_c0_g1~~TRINITY_DN1073_c0_g1_i2.p3  ORF type:complete len:139 (-),score=48.23 TRINITY_DN1073_c0_g1_i2:593-1009(-)